MGLVVDAKRMTDSISEILKTFDIHRSMCVLEINDRNHCCKSRTVQWPTTGPLILRVWLELSMVTSMITGKQ